MLREVEALTVKDIVGFDVRVARVRDFGAGPVIYIPEQALCESNARALRDWLTRALDGDGMVVVPRECSGEVWSDLKAELCKHMLRERSESDPDRRMALLDVAALDLYAVVIAAQGGGP